MNARNPNSLIVKATLLLTSSLTVMAGATIAPALPEMQEVFSKVEGAEYLVKLVLTLPALFIVIGSPIAGIIVDRFGRKPLLAASALLYGIAGSSGYFVNDLTLLLLGRAFLGLSVGGIMTCATTLISDYYKGPTRAHFMGLQAAFMSFGGVIFLSLGGWFAGLNWHGPFLIYSFALAIFPLILFVLYEPELNETNPNIQNPEQISLATPVKLLMLIYSMALLNQIVFYMIPVQLPFYLKSLTNATAAQSGLAISFATLFSGLASIGYGWIKARLDYIKILTIIFGCIGIGYGIIGTVQSYGLVLVGLAISGVGLGLLMPNLTVWLSSSVSDSLRGRALGGLSTSLFLGQFLSPICSEPLSQQIGLGNTFSFAGVLMVIFAFVFLLMNRQIMSISRT